MNTSAHDLNKLRHRAADVLQDAAPPRMTARATAACLSGAVRLLAIQHGVRVMRQACADLAGNDLVWSDPRCRLPITDPTFMLATVARGILPMSGVENMRAALSFWATEDAAAWQAVAG